jgi:hypothetical protein
MYSLLKQQSFFCRLYMFQNKRVVIRREKNRRITEVKTFMILTDVKEILSLHNVYIIILFSCIKSDPRQNLFAHIVVLTINEFWSCVSEIVKAIGSFHIDFPWWNSVSFRFILVFLLFVVYNGIRQPCVCAYLYCIIPLLRRY